jgi:hypothetical protein
MPFAVAFVALWRSVAAIRCHSVTIVMHPNGFVCRNWLQYLYGNNIMRFLAPFLLLAFVTPATAQPTPVDVAAARASLAGQWQGSLEYLDYGANKWFGIPVKTLVEDQGDGATMIRKSDFDDGPATGNVRITSVELYDPAAGTITTGTFRKGRKVEVDSYTVRIEGRPVDAVRWTMVEETLGTDDNRPATLRLTTTRDGDKIETVKQIDFQDDDRAEWITRNRTRLTLAR